METWSESLIRLEGVAFDDLVRREWLVTNGIGGFAGSSLCGANARRYHGLLVASLNPPTERMMMVSRTEEEVHVGDTWYPLSANRFPDAVHPEGHKHLVSFKRLPVPEFRYKVNGAEISRAVFMVHGSNTTVVEYTNHSDKEVNLKIQPLYAVRDYHGLLHETHDHKYFVKQLTNGFGIYAFAGAPPVYTCFYGGRFHEDRKWIKNFEYDFEAQRGQDCHEDLFAVGTIEHSLSPGERWQLVFTTDKEVLQKDFASLRDDEVHRINNLAGDKTLSPFHRDLLTCADQFLVKRKSTSNFTIIAGYHWFTDWGRDSMIALRGLLIATGQKDAAKSVILTFLQFLNQGVIPNRFPDYENDLIEYHTIDATLWLFVAVYEYDQAFNDTAFLEEVFPKLCEIIDWHMKGTLHDIHVTVRGFLYGAAENLPLTWMDARTGTQVFTPRQGCPVEINALWYNALEIYHHACSRTGKEADEKITALRDRLKTAFPIEFWNAEGYLNDVVKKNGTPDSSIRPNQIFAVSLPFRLLTPEQEKKVVETVAHHLCTPFGLRTLSPGHPGFRSHYEGDLLSRDAAYHQGTVWPFLLPEFILAFLRVNNRSEEAIREAARMLEPLKKHFYENECIHAISEIFDGLDPATGKGCAQQAWSVSNILWLIHREKLKV